MDLPEVYTNEKVIVLTNSKQLFIYEVCVFCRYPSYFSIVNRVFYSSEVEIPNVVKCFMRDPHTEITCELYSAPLDWLLTNSFIKYIKPDKKVKTTKNIDNVKPQITVNKRANSTIANKTTRTRTKKL